ncbi:MAG: prolipoprotein diacylglyceryl transferase [Gammaproteobacteria bacterium]
MIQFPNIDPIALQIGPLAIRWYGISYLVGIGLAWLFLTWRAKHRDDWNSDQVADLVVSCALGAVLGGRIGYIFLYKLSSYASDPLSIFKVWEGGMSFHGGLIGVLIAFALYSRKNDKSFFQVADFTAPAVPIGLFFGRIANFINGELWGAPTDKPWGVIFPGYGAGNQPRHPSQLYEAALEGIFLFLILWIFSRSERPLKAISGLFLLGYGCFRFLVEFVREPDSHVGYVAFDWVTLGQIYSLPMIVIGLFLIFLAYKNGTNQKRENF